MITHDPSYVKHVLGGIYVFFTLFAYWVCCGGESPMDSSTTWFCSFSPWSAQKIEVSEIHFFDIATTHNDHPSYVKHVLGGIYVASTPFGNCARV